MQVPFQFVVFGHFPLVLLECPHNRPTTEYGVESDLLRPALRRLGRKTEVVDCWASWWGGRIYQERCNGPVSPSPAPADSPRPASRRARIRGSPSETMLFRFWCRVELRNPTAT